jgi:hypothetical protein
MVFNPWIEKGRHFYGHAEAVPDVTILKSAIWLERKYGEAPSLKTAGIISLHYLVLALRKQAGRKALLFDLYMSQVLRWKREARHFGADQQRTQATDFVRR